MKISLGGLDYTIPAASFLFVITVGWFVRRRVRTSEGLLQPWHRRPAILALIVGTFMIVLNLIYW
jgi:hypothetical protein